jgi:acyl-[acyl-carrier-protein]-phospholipid O-acyltransferase/long-chain-fatty-acid--[acyl-carrier-protein] ligase
MILIGIILLALAVGHLAGAAWLSASRKISFHQALLYLPLKLLYRVDDRRARLLADAPAPVIYVVTHRSRLDPALMLSLLPTNTLHILDETSAKSMRLEPFKALARTIAFNAEHLFVSRRLVRHLRAKAVWQFTCPRLSSLHQRPFPCIGRWRALPRARMPTSFRFSSAAIPRRGLVP